MIGFIYKERKIVFHNNDGTKKGFLNLIFQYYYRKNIIGSYGLDWLIKHENNRRYFSLIIRLRLFEINLLIMKNIKHELVNITEETNGDD